MELFNLAKSSIVKFKNSIIKIDFRKRYLMKVLLDKSSNDLNEENFAISMLFSFSHVNYNYKTEIRFHT